MSILKTTKTALLGSVLAMGFASGALAEDYTITVWSGGTGETGSYRWEAIQMAADILEREYAVTGQDVSITVEHQEWTGWDDFKQAVTLAAEAGNAPNIIVSGHEDIGPWSRSGLLRPVEDYVDFDAWPLSQIYPNLIDIASYDGVVWGLPQDAEARPFFFSRAHLAEIGYSQEEIDALPQRVQDGEYTLYDMLDDAKAMQDKGVVAERRGFMPRVNNGTDYWQFYVSFGGDMVDPETGKLVLDRQALTDMYQFFVDAADMGVVSSTHLGSTWDDWHQAVSSDQVGIWHGGTWHKAEWEAKWGLKDFFGEIQYSLIPAGNERGRSELGSLPRPVRGPNLGMDGKRNARERAQAKPNGGFGLPVLHERLGGACIGAWIMRRARSESVRQECAHLAGAIACRTHATHQSPRIALPQHHPAVDPPGGAGDLRREGVARRRSGVVERGRHAARQRQGRHAGTEEQRVACSAAMRIESALPCGWVGELRGDVPVTCAHGCSVRKISWYIRKPRASFGGTR